MSAKVNPSYVFARLMRALGARDAQVSPEARARVEARIEAWRRVAEGLVSGELHVGSRTPTAAPPWVTLEVLRGGFASGAYAAAGPLCPHERARLERLGWPPDASARARLNASYLDDAGLEELSALLDSGLYRVDLPEEGALLALAWLLREGQGEAASALLQVLTPWMPTLRFYPRPAERPLEVRPRVLRQSVAETIRGIEALGPQRDVARMNIALSVWAPFVDQGVALALETVDGAPPAWAPAEGRRLTGGWPLRVFPSGWVGRTQAWLDAFEPLAARHPPSHRHTRPGETLFELRRVLARAVSNPDQLTEADAARLRVRLAAIAGKRGLPGSERAQALVAQRNAYAARPLHAELRSVLLERLRRLPLDGGLDAIDALLEPVRADEARLDAARPIEAGTRLPRALEVRVARSLEAPVDVLVERGVLPSPEAVAEVLPQLSAFVKASALRDPALRRLYGATYVAFRARRTLLLLGLAAQVRLEELPWVAAMEVHRGDPLSAAEYARETLRALVLLVLQAFPHVILPNPLVTELGALSRAAGHALPLVEELAADIFEGTFTDTFLRAALDAAALLEGTVYERYYDARFAEVRALGAEVDARSKRPAIAEGFGRLCVSRVGAPRSRSSVSANGAVIEQSQLLTTHNLATLFRALDLAAALGDRLPALAQACFAWVLARAPKAARAPRLLQLRARKNMAYAWRQMLFFLAVAEPETHAPFVAWALETFGAAPPEVQARMGSWVQGLVGALQGAPVEAAQRFLGWVPSRS